MKRRSVEEGQELVKKYRESSLALERFAKKARINVAVLCYWLRRVRVLRCMPTDTGCCTEVGTEERLTG